MRKKNPSQDIFVGSVKGLANTLAVVVTFLIVPLIYDFSNRWIVAYTAAHYGTGLESFISFCWFIACALTVFFLSRASLSTSLMIGGMALATRLL